VVFPAVRPAASLDHVKGTEYYLAGNAPEEIRALGRPLEQRGGGRIGERLDRAPIRHDHVRRKLVELLGRQAEVARGARDCQIVENRVPAGLLRNHVDCCTRALTWLCRGARVDTEWLATAASAAAFKDSER
jgi:hypothetical protein